MQVLQPRMKEIQQKYVKQMPAATKANKSARALKAKELGSDFFEDACAFLDSVRIDLDSTSWCYACNSYCKFTPTLSPDALWIEIAGNTCMPWSAAGALLGWLDSMSLPALV